MLISSVQQSDSIIHTYIYILQVIECSSLPYTVDPCCLSILYIVVYIYWRRKWQPTPVFLPGESQEPGSPLGCRLWGCTELDTTEAT